MAEITKISVDVLHVHPRNQEFFDDISGKDYEQFKTSIKEDGIISGIIVAPDMTILSGHQRFKAAKELGMKTVPIRIRDDVETEDQKLKILLAANFGRKQNDAAKQRKIAAEYVALCGMKAGDNQWSCQNGATLSLEEIAAQLGTNKRSLQRSLRIERNLTEEMKQLLDDGVISETFAADVIAAMSEDDQMKFISSLDITKKYTAKELKSLLDENELLKTKKSQREKFEKDRADRLQKENEKLKDELNESHNKADATEEAPPFPENPQVDIIQSPEYQELLEKYNELISQHNTDQEVIENKEADIKRLQLSMDDETYKVTTSNKILAALSRVNSVIETQLVPLLYDDDLCDISEVLSEKVEASLSKNIDIMRDCITKLHTGNYIDVTVENVI